MSVFLAEQDSNGNVVNTNNGTAFIAQLGSLKDQLKNYFLYFLLLICRWILY